MKKNKVTSWWNYTTSEPEYSSGEIVTVPDQAFTIEEILDKFTRGIDVGELYRDGRYTNSDNFDEVDYSRDVNDPYDIGEEILDEVPKFRRKKDSKKSDELPEDGDLQTVPKDDGAKDDKKES